LVCSSAPDLDHPPSLRDEETIDYSMTEPSTLEELLLHKAPIWGTRWLFKQCTVVCSQKM